MYIPKHFFVEDRIILTKFIVEYPLATVIANSSDEFEINHVPLLLSQDGKRLHGHIAKVNPLATLAELTPGAKVAAVFNGPNGYVTPSWYPTKKETGKVVPTWNYAVVHVKGHIRLIKDPQWIRDHVSSMSAIHEPTHNSIWKLTDAPENYVQDMLSMIIGIEIDIDYMYGKFKLSQNKNESDYSSVIEGFKQSSLQEFHNMLKLMPDSLTSISNNSSAVAVPITITANGVIHVKMVPRQN